MDKNKISKKEIHTFVKNKLSTNDVWAKAALLKIFDFQTRDEKESESTHIYNKVGFTGIDGEILTSFAKQLQRKNWLSDKQMKIVFKKMPKYHNQIINISDEKKLLEQIKSTK